MRDICSIGGKKSTMISISGQKIKKKYSPLKKLVNNKLIPQFFEFSIFRPWNEMIITEKQKSRIYLLIERGETVRQARY